ncbi:MAG: thiamine pyrophosphate-binding protein [Rhodobacter sp.]|nr:thiamine pyrophosphate-binding protein [Rhodobacter sp.]
MDDATSTRPLGAQIAHMLAVHGVDTVFGIPGVHNIELYRGIEQAGLTHVLARHEQGAGFMADGYARATGNPGVAFVITGPGLTNIMTPLGQAYSDNVPVLVISSCLDETVMTKGQLHQMKDQRLAAETVCDWSEEARSPQAAYHLIDRTFREFFTGRMRPKHIQVPVPLLETPCPPPDLDEFPRGEARLLPDPMMVGVTVHQLKRARRPLLILGGGARGAFPLALDAPNHLNAFIDKVRPAVFTTYAGRGTVAPGYRLSFGSMLARPDSEQVIAEADFVLAVGTELSEVDLWRPRLGHTARLTRVDISDAALSAPVGAFWHIRADAHSFFEAMMAELGDAALSNDWTADEVSAARTRWRAQVDAERPGILPVCDALRAALPEDTLIYSDMTQFAYVAKEVWDLAAPGLWHHPFGFGTLGYALPAAIGGKVGAGDRPVVAIAGDYGFQYTLQELGTAAELGLSLPILVWDNAMLKEIEASMARAQIAPIAVQALNPDFGALAAAYGLDYACPGTLPELQSAVTAALDAPGPTLIRMTPALVG